MQKKRPNRIVQGGVICFGAMAGTVAWDYIKAKPNVCLIVVDSLRAGAISKSAGAALTPNLHALIEEGVEFRRAFSHAPSTLPSHVSMFSGQLPHESGVISNGQTIPGQVELLTERLENFGYETRGFAGLQELWRPEVGQGIERGFDEWVQSEEVVSRSTDTEAAVLPFLDDIANDNPFFLYAHFADPHAPYDANGLVKHDADILLDGVPVTEISTSEQTFFNHELRISPGLHIFEIRSHHPFHLRSFDYNAPEKVEVTVRKSDLEIADRDVSIAIQNDGDEICSVSVEAWIHDAPSTTEARIRYRREVQAVDTAIGRIVEDLKDRGVYDDTLIVITSNHGEALGEHGVVGHDVSLYDELLHVPLIMKLPVKSKFKEPLEALRDRIARHIDLVPTLAELLGLPPVSDTSGQSLLVDEDRVLFAETHQPEAPRDLVCMRDERYKLIYDASANTFEMYDLSQDPSELDDVFRTQGHLRDAWQLDLKATAKGVVGS